MTPRRIAHPDRLDRACDRMQNALDAWRDGFPPELIRCVATPAHSILSSIYGGNWAVVRACLWYALRCSLYNAQPVWFMRWRYGIGADSEAGQ